MKTLLLALSAVLFSACAGSGGGGTPASSSLKTHNPNVTLPGDDASPIETVFKNWGPTSTEFSLDFASLSLGARTQVFWYVYDQGQYGVNGREYRRCRAYVTITGSASQGAITIDSAETIWEMNPGDPDIYCEAENGTRSFTVLASGLSLDGVTYQEAR